MAVAKNGTEIMQMDKLSLSKELTQSIEEFESQADEIVNPFAREPDKEPHPRLIYHYTDGTGLRGILKSGTLWFTDMFSLNDPTELRHGLNPAIKILTQRAHNGLPELGRIADIIHKMVNGGVEDIAYRVEDIAQHFVFCFSKDRDDLGQWRAYADNGRGYAIGFDRGMLRQAFIIESGVDNSKTFPITYRDERLYEMQKEIIDKFIPLLSLFRERELHSRDPIPILLYLSNILMAHIFHSALFFKHKAYKNENEYRFLQAYAAGLLPDVKYRDRRYSLVRYTEFYWRRVAAGSLKKIIIGPAADRTLARQFANDCLREFQVDGVEICQSDIPYRAL